MYGTTMIATLAEGVGADAVRAVLDDWARDHPVEGFASSHVLVSDDGKTVVNAVFFESKQAYQALSADPSQAAWWEERFAPLLAGEPRWIDGPWSS